MAEIVPGIYVLDTFALIAYLQGETGHELVRSLIERTASDVTLCISLINFGELAYLMERKFGLGRATSILADIKRLPLAMYHIDEARILAAAHIKAQHAVSYADAFALALAQELGGVIVSGDPEIHAMGELVRILWV